MNLQFTRPYIPKQQFFLEITNRILNPTSKANEKTEDLMKTQNYDWIQPKIYTQIATHILAYSRNKDLQRERERERGRLIY